MGLAEQQVWNCAEWPDSPRKPCPLKTDGLRWSSIELRATQRATAGEVSSIGPALVLARHASRRSVEAVRPKGGMLLSCSVPPRSSLEYGAIVWAGFFLFVVAYEEPALGEQFADEYKRYRVNVRRWLPRITPWRG